VLEPGVGQHEALVARDRDADRRRLEDGLALEPARSLAVTSRALITTYSRRSIAKRAPDTRISTGWPVLVTKVVVCSCTWSCWRSCSTKASRWASSCQMPSSTQVRPTTSAAA
jgi:hypothetical protein